MTFTLFHNIIILSLKPNFKSSIFGGNFVTKAVIFDLDGLLIDSEMMSYEICRHFVEQQGGTLSVKDYAEHYCGHTAVSNITRIINKYGITDSLDECLAKTRALEAEYIKRGIPLKKGAPELLNYLKEQGIKICLASSSTRGRAYTLLSQNGIDGFFDDGVFGNEAERSKPAPDIFLKAREKLKMPASECLVLEDSEAGVRAAHTAGIPVICIPDLKQPSDGVREMAQAVLPSLETVIDILKSERA